MTSTTLSPENARLILNTIFLPSLQREHQVTKSVIEAIPANKSDYRPEANTRSALDLAWHIAASEQRFLSAVVEGKFNFDAVPRPDSANTPAGISQWYDEMFQVKLSQLQQLSGDQLARVIDFRGALQLSAVQFLQLMLHHSIHHRGQLSAFIRPMGGKVPAIYGESYDSAEARKAIQSKSA